MLEIHGWETKLNPIFKEISRRLELAYHQKTLEVFYWLLLLPTWNEYYRILIIGNYICTVCLLHLYCK